MIGTERFYMGIVKNVDHRKGESTMNIKHSNTKKLIVLLIICIAMTFILSELFIITHAAHDCIGEHCYVCAQIHTLENLLKQLSIVGIIIMAGFFKSLTTFVFVSGNKSYVNMTPIILKVRMNN